ncbi:Uncharacterised protein [Sphingobacterium multivorum]|uniref:Uncharacterized protein n=1 Tax=Sphingobacterium multivorum TaxID=28454 RepID=A0A2X2LIL0_SPHMU|nr:hypothetical protein [Sphingobacterium multivorum]SPZ93089.1 Uncharacterised protein [Sphingobacterium multivorum]
MRKKSFLPLVNSTTEILILGSLPGDNLWQKMNIMHIHKIAFGK